MLKYFLQASLWIVLLFSIYGNVFWESDICGEWSGFSLYECRNKNICETYKSEKPTYIVKDYEVAENIKAKYFNQQSQAPALDAAKEIYRENIGNIYKCAMIQAQRNALTFLAKQLKQEDSGKLDDTIGGQIKLRIKRLERSSTVIGCALTDKENIQNKLNVLRETTYEACRYINYLEYLKGYYNKMDRFNNDEEYRNSYWDNAKNIRKRFPVWELPAIINGIQSDIADEISHTYKVFPIAYRAYSEYENNFPIHFLLEIIRADFLILQKNLYATLMPIAQLWLKVINAMSY